MILTDFSFLSAQKVAKISFFDKNGNLASVEDAYYFRETTDSADFYKSYYAIDSSIYFTGKILSAKDSSDKKNIYNGLCTWHELGGTKKKAYNYNNKGLFHGTCIDYYVNGKPKKIAEYFDGKLLNKTYLEFGSNGASAKVTEDDFTDNINNWYITSTNKGSTKIKIGGLEFISKTNLGLQNIFNSKTFSKNYSVEVLINSNYLIDSTKAGLIFKYKDSINYNYFIVSKHSCSIGSVKNGIETKSIYNFFTPTITGSGINRIKLFYFKNKLLYSINDVILFSDHESDTTESKIGLTIRTKGIAFFDKLIIKEYLSDLVTDPINEEIKNDNVYAITEQDGGLKSLFTGLLLNKKGLILTSAKNFEHYNQIIVETYIKDTIKQFYAELIIKDPAHDIAVLKILNPLNLQLTEPVFTFCDKAEIKPEYELYSVYFNRSNKDENKVRYVTGKLKTKTSLVSISGFYMTTLTTDPISSGSPLFTDKGELIGVLTLNDIESAATKLYHINNLLFLARQNFEKPKKREHPADAEAVSKNIVLIKVK